MVTSGPGHTESWVGVARWASDCVVKSEWANLVLGVSRFSKGHRLEAELVSEE